MGLCKEDVTLYLENTNEDEDNLKLCNSDTNRPKDSFHCKLTDFLCSNSCFDLSRVTTLEICKSNISEIPHSMKNLKLKSLILAHNKFEEIPSCLYTGLESLELLDLSHNRIEIFDVEPACGPNLVSLNMAHNSIRTFPNWILMKRCPKLQEVDYSSNYMLKFSTVHDLFIKKLELKNAQLIDEDFVFLKRIKTLEYLDIGNDKPSKNENFFKNINKLFVKFKWRSLLILKLNNLMLSIIPKEMFWVTSLTELHLVNCDLNWIPEEIQYLTNLEVLDVSQNSICSLPKCFTCLPNLREVHAPSNYISAIAEFSSKLEILDLYNNQLEEIPSLINEIEFIDLEQNIIDISLCEFYVKYKEKRDKFRTKFSHSSRTDGPVELPEEPPFSDDEKMSDDLSYSCDSQFCVKTDEEEECWDEIEPVSIIYAKHPDVTVSDDEWDGKIETRKKKVKADNSLWFDENEDWIFCDVEEL